MHTHTHTLSYSLTLFLLHTYTHTLYLFLYPNLTSNQLTFEFLLSCFQHQSLSSQSPHLHHHPIPYPSISPRRAIQLPRCAVMPTSSTPAGTTAWSLSRAGPTARLHVTTSTAFNREVRLDDGTGPAARLALVSRYHHCRPIGSPPRSIKLRPPLSTHPLFPTTREHGTDSFQVDRHPMELLLACRLTRRRPALGPMCRVALHHLECSP